MKLAKRTLAILVALMMTLGLFAVAASAIASEEAFKDALEARREALDALEDAFGSHPATLAFMLIAEAGEHLVAFVGADSHARAQAFGRVETAAEDARAAFEEAEKEFADDLAAAENLPEEFTFGADLAAELDRIFGLAEDAYKTYTATMIAAFNANLLPAVLAIGTQLARAAAIEALIEDKDTPPTAGIGAEAARREALIAATDAASYTLANAQMENWIASMNWAAYEAALAAANNAAEKVLADAGLIEGPGNIDEDCEDDCDCCDDYDAPWTDNVRPAFVGRLIARLPSFLQTAIYYVGFFWLANLLFW
jgi:hypothetical protein